MRLAFHARGGAVLATAIGASRAQVAVCDLAGEILARAGFSVDLAPGPEMVLTSVVRRMGKLLAESGRTVADVRGVGVTLPSAVDVETGRSVSPAVVPGWGDVAIADHFTARFPGPVRVENDVNMLALAEQRRRPEVDDILVIKASTSIGAAIIGNGRLQRGALGAAGEIGHIKVADAGGAVCRCGDLDCLEAVASGWALTRSLAASGREVRDARGVADLVRAGDPDAVRLVREAGRRLGEVLAGAVNLLNPALIVIGGDLAYAYEPLVAGVRELVYQRSSAIVTRTLRIAPAVLEEEASVLACAGMVLDQVLSPEAVDVALSATPAPLLG
ncbi:MAG: ROK family protein [Micromonosporaceae bacterium]|nr:ROK family protein [Micromonosporaceae bacterium]